MSYAVLVLEQPWGNLDDDPGQTSVRYFLDGLSRLHGLPIFYATFYDTNSFSQALKYLLDARKLDDVKHLIVYVASHGAGARIGRDDHPGMNLRTVFDRLAEYGKGKIAGLILDSCEVGGETKTIQAGMRLGGIHWTLGYAASVDWLVSMFINLHVLAVMPELTGKALDKPEKLCEALQAALSPFNPWQVIADEDEDSEGEIILAEALSVFVRKGKGRSKGKLLAAEQIWPELAEDDDDPEDNG